MHPLKYALQIFTDTSKEGWGAHLEEHTGWGTWSLPESKLHINHLELKAVFLALKEFQNLCCKGDEIGFSLCPIVENSVLVYQEAGDPQGTSHHRPAECDSRQAIQTWLDHSNRVVTSSRSIPSYMLPVAPAPGGSVCHQVEQQTATVSVTGPRPPGMGGGCTQPFLRGPGPIYLSPSSHLGQSGGKVA